MRTTLDIDDDVLQAAKELGVTATTERGSNLSMNLTLMQDGYPGLEHAMPVFPLLRDVTQLEAQSGITKWWMTTCSKHTRHIHRLIIWRG